MATKIRKEKVVLLPKNLLEKSNGFSFDFGGSVIKVCYINKTDWENHATKSEAPLRMTSFAREDLHECLEFIHKNAYILRTSKDEKQVIFNSGFGFLEYGKLIEEKLNVKLESISEMDAFVRSMMFLLESKQLEEYCVPFEQETSDEIRAIVLKEAQMSLDMYENGTSSMIVTSEAVDELKKQYDRTADLKQCCMGTFGSAWATMKIGCYDKKAEHTLANFTTLGGRSFLGLGCLLTGAKNYEELMSLAEAGNNLNIDTSEAEIAGAVSTETTSGGNDMYSVWQESEPSDRAVFQWAKGYGKTIADFRREDVARSLLHSICYQLAMMATNALVLARCRHLFVAGSFCSSPLVRKIVTQEFEHRKLTSAWGVEGMTADYHIHFLEYGSHMGALGALILGAEKHAA